MRRLNLMRYFCEYIQYMYFWKDTNSQFFGHVKVWQTLFQTLESELERMVFNCFLDSLEKSFLIIAYEHPGIVDRMFRNWALSMDLSSELMDWVQLSSAIKRNRTLNQIESDSIEQIKLNSTQSNRLLDWIWQPNSIEHSPVDCGWWINLREKWSFFFGLKNMNNMCYTIDSNLSLKKLVITIDFQHQSVHCGRHSGLMVSALDSRVNSLGSSSGQGHYVVFLGKTLNSHSASLHPGI